MRSRHAAAVSASTHPPRHPRSGATPTLAPSDPNRGFHRFQVHLVYARGWAGLAICWSMSHAPGHLGAVRTSGWPGRRPAGSGPVAYRRHPRVHEVLDVTASQAAADVARLQFDRRRHGRLIGSRRSRHRLGRIAGRVLPLFSGSTGATLFSTLRYDGVGRCACGFSHADLHRFDLAGLRPFVHLALLGEARPAPPLESSHRQMRSHLTAVCWCFALPAFDAAFSPHAYGPGFGVMASPARPTTWDASRRRPSMKPRLDLHHDRPSGSGVVAIAYPGRVAVDVAE